MEFLDDINVFITRVANALKVGGMFSVNGFEVSTEHIFWKKIFAKIGLKTAFIEEKLQAEETHMESFRKLLQNCFAKIENVTLDNSMQYDNREEILERLYQRYPENRKYIEENKVIIGQYFDRFLDEEDVVIVDNTSDFWHCIK